MKMTLTTEQAVDMFGILSNSTSTTLDDAERIKLLDVRRVLRPIAKPYESFAEDARETLKFAGFDELSVKASSNALKGDEILAWNMNYVRYQKSLKAALDAELKKECEIDVVKISRATFIALLKENHWKNGVEDILDPIIE
jgi:hypothetical protein